MRRFPCAWVTKKESGSHKTVNAGLTLNETKEERKEDRMGGSILDINKVFVDSLSQSRSSEESCVSWEWVGQSIPAMIYFLAGNSLREA